MKKDSKADATLIVAGMGAPEKEKEASEEGKDQAASDVMAALQSGDVDALKEALSAFIEMCY